MKVLLGALHEADAEVHGGDQGDCDGRGGQVTGPQPQQVQVRNPPKLTLLVFTVNESYPVLDNIEGTQKRSIGIRPKLLLMDVCAFLNSVRVKRLLMLRFGTLNHSYLIDFSLASHFSSWAVHALTVQ